MTSEEAIEILKGKNNSLTLLRKQAEQLGIEALERVKRDRDRDMAIGFIPDRIDLLPSETRKK